MSVASISSSNVLNQASQPQSQIQQQNKFQQLAQALQSGNLNSAQQVFGALTQNLSGSSGLRSAQATQELKALGSALQSGSLAGAQTAYSAFKQDVQSTAAAGHVARHGHHHRGREQKSGPSGSGNSSSSDSSGIFGAPSAIAGNGNPTTNLLPFLTT